MTISPELRVAGALSLFGPSAFASHGSAARLLRLPVTTDPDEHVTVLSLEERRSREGIRCHATRSAQVRTSRGLRLSAPEQLFVELAETLCLLELVVVGDHLVKRGLVTVTGLNGHCATIKGVLGRSVRRAAAYVRERVDSPMETRLRMLLVLAGTPEPVVNLTIRDVDGEPIRRFDLCWPTVRVIVEYDGRQHIEREANWAADLDRREAIDEDGWRLLVITASGIYVDPDRRVSRVFRVLKQRGLTGLPPLPSEDWMPHFPGRR